MKRHILIIAMSLLIAVLAAETGLFELSFGQSSQEADKALLAKGFQETARGFMYVIYENDQMPELERIVVYDYTNNGTISDWSTEYRVKDNPKLIEKILADLTAIHGVEPQIISSLNEWIWIIQDPYELRASLGEDKSILQVEYITDQEMKEMMDWFGW